VAVVVLLVGAGSCGDGPDRTETEVSPQPPTSPADLRASVVSVTGSGGSALGVVFTGDGYILTSSRAGMATGAAVTVALVDGRSNVATVVGSDPRTTLAIVKVDTASGLVPAAFGDSDAAGAGDAVRLFGKPVLSGSSPTSGVVRDATRTIGGVSMIETDIAGQAGDAGAPLVNTTGEVVGIIVAITAGAGGQPVATLAVPANTAAHVAGQLIAGQPVTHPYLGVTVDNADGDGALVRSVATGSPAARAGLRPGDLIVKIGDRPVGDPDEFVAAIQASSVGSVVTLVYIRAGSEHETTVTIGQEPRAVLAQRVTPARLAHCDFANTGSASVCHAADKVARNLH
jgi:putative serine protease PepD